MNTENAEQFEAGRDRIFHAITAAINRKSATVGFELHGGQRGRPNVMYSFVVGQNEARRLFDFAVVQDSHTELSPLTILRGGRFAALPGHATAFTGAARKLWR